MTNPASLDYLNDFRKIYDPVDEKGFDHLTTISHEGNMIVFVMEGARIKYTVLGATDQVPNDTDAWPDNLQTLLFPTELQIAGQEGIGNFVMPLVVEQAEVSPTDLSHEAARELDLFASTTARLGQKRDFHVVSTDMHVYVFRQSIVKTDALNVALKPGAVGSAAHLTVAATGGNGLIDNTVLVDRFVLVDGDKSKMLVPMRESRYQRSRNRSLPAGRSDTLGQTDMEGRPFFEPTVALTMISHVGPGGFCVMTIPSEQGNGRWQLFVHDEGTRRIEGFSIARDDMGGFDLQGERFYTSPDPQYRSSVLERRPGKCPFTRLPLIPHVKENLGEPRWVLRVPGNQPFFARSPVGRLASPLPVFDADGTHGMCIEFWVKVECDVTLSSIGVASVDNRKTLPAGRWSHVQVNCVVVPKGNTLTKELRIDIDSSDRDPVFRRSIVTATPLPVELLKEVLALLQADFRIAELRVYNLPRTAQNAVHDRNFQLRGDELFLIAYYPLGGGSDLTLDDHVRPADAPTDPSTALQAQAGTQARWVLDNPPLQENPGVNRRALLNLGSRSPIGLSCLLYHEQMAGKMDMRDLARGDVRAMLAVTEALTANASGNVLVLDWNVTASGRLVRTKPLGTWQVDHLRPVQLQSMAERLNDLKTRKGDLQAKIDQLAHLLASVPPAPPPPNFTAQVAALMQQQSDAANHPLAGNAQVAAFLNQQPTGLPPDAFGLLSGHMGGRSMEPAAAGPADVPARTAADGASDAPADQLTVAQQRERLGHYRIEMQAIDRALRDCARLGHVTLDELHPDHALPYREAMPVTGTDGLGSTQCAAQLPFVTTGHRATLFEAAGGTVSLYFAQKAAGRSFELACATYDAKAVRHAIEHDVVTADGSRAQIRFASHQSDAAAPATRTRMEIVRGAPGTETPETLTVTVSNPVLGVEETWSGLPNNVAGLIDTINGLAAIAIGSKVVRLHGEVFVDNLAAFPSRLVTAQWVGEGTQHIGLREAMPEGLPVPGLTPAWASAPTGYSFAACQRFVASLENDGGLGKMHGDRAVTLESWVFPLQAEAQNDTRYQGVIRMKDTRVADSTKIFNYGLALTTEVGNRTIHRKDGHIIYSGPEGPQAQSFSFAAGGSLAVVMNERQPKATIETLFRFRSISGTSTFFKLSTHLSLLIELDNLYVADFLTPNGPKRFIKTLETDRWYHLALIVDGPVARILIDGDVYASSTSANRSFARFEFTSEGNTLELTELRVWSELRSIADIRALSGIALNAEAREFDAIVAYLPPMGMALTPGLSPATAVPIANYAEGEKASITARAPGLCPSPFRTVRCVFDDVALQSVVGIRQEYWSHLAVRYAHAYGLQLSAQLRVEAEAAEGIFDRDLTVEAALMWNAGEATLLRQSFEDDDAHHAFRFGIEEDGGLVFAYSAIDGSSPLNPSTSRTQRTYVHRSTRKLSPATFQSVAVQRWTRKIRIAEYAEGAAFGNGNKLHESHREEEQVQVEFFIDGQACGAFKINQPVNVFNREGVGEIPLYPRDGVATDKLVQEARESKSPPTTSNGAEGKPPFFAPKVEGNVLPMVMGDRFVGVLYEVRLWSVKARISREWSPPQGARSGLAHWWLFNDRQGARVIDSVDAEGGWTTKKGKEEKAGTWVRSQDTTSHPTTMLINGVPVRTEPDTRTEAIPGDRGFCLGDNFCGLIDEVRIWNGERTDEAIRDNLFVRLNDEFEDLIAYYPLSHDHDNEVHDEGHAGANLVVTERGPRRRRPDGAAQGRGWDESLEPDHHSLNDSPARQEIGLVATVLAPFHNRFVRTVESPVWAQEYADVQMASDGAVAGVYKRAYAYLAEGGLHVVTGFKVGSLTTEWVSQVQYDPQLVGYVEGAPPVPGENLTLGPKTLKLDYNAVSAVELVDAATNKYTYSQSKEKAAKNLADAEATYQNTYGLGSIVLAPMGLGLSLKAAATFGGGYKGKYESSNGVVSKNGVITEREVKKTTRFQLNGYWQSTSLDGKLINGETPSDQDKGYNKTLGLRFLTENKGLALVKSKTADVFALRLRGHAGIVAYRMIPSADIPEDFNLMTFDINPKYTKQGTLDGRIGFDGDESSGFKTFYDPDYLGCSDRGEYSYFKPREAYRLKAQIDREEARLSTYFKSFDYRATAASKGYESLSPLLPGTIAGGVAAGVAGVAATVSTGTAILNSIVAGALGSGPAYGGLAVAASNLPAALGPVLSAAGIGVMGTSVANVAKLKKAYDATPDELKSEPARRNLMNTYVWTASGGFFELNTTQKDTFSETYTGKFTTTDLHGGYSENVLEAKSTPLSLKMTVKLTGYMGNALAVERSKQHDSSEGFSLKVTLTPPNNIRHYVFMSQQEWNFAYHDPYGKTDLPGKVDAYRFMTFFLDGKESHHDDFFEKVVDQKWLNQSSDPNAAALRPLKARGTKSRPWRVMHRVTFVSRILPKSKPAQAGEPETVEQAMTTLQIKSNFELITMLEPSLGGATNTVRSLKKQLRKVLAEPRFSPLLPFEHEIGEMLVRFYGIPEEVH